MPKYLFMSYRQKQTGNKYGQAMEDGIIREAMRGETETKNGEYRNFRKFKKGRMRIYWGTKKNRDISRGEYALNKIYLFKQLEDDIEEKTIVHILAGQLDVEIQNKVTMDETKKFDKLLRILKTHDQCEKGVIIDTNILSQYGLIMNLDERCIKWENSVVYFVEEDTKVIHEVTTLDKEMSVNNFNIEEVDENVKMCKENKIPEEIYDEEKDSNEKKEDIEAYKCDEKYRNVIQKVTTLDKEMNINNVNIEEDRKVV
ncbi:hypothetical protein FQA39_LY11781 [Lamprigera yunnana]|nr:hypothetical protein FQA39_LY11781 [Lamprigera yunnana]